MSLPISMSFFAALTIFDPQPALALTMCQVHSSGAPASHSLASLLENTSRVVDRMAPPEAISEATPDRQLFVAVQSSDLIYRLFQKEQKVSPPKIRRGSRSPIDPVVHAGDGSVAPDGYALDLSWNDNAKTGVANGAYMGLFVPVKNNTDPLVLAFKGTNSRKDEIEDIVHHGAAQFASISAMKMPKTDRNVIQFLLDRLKNGRDVIITGHSLGGGLAESTAYVLQKELDLLPDSAHHGKIHLITFNALGGQNVLEHYDRANKTTLAKGIDPSVVGRIDARNFRVKGDPISSLFSHIGPTYQLRLANPKAPTLLGMATEVTNFLSDSDWAQLERRTSGPIDAHRMSTARLLVETSYNSSP